MCGIFGVYWRDPRGAAERELLKSMAHALRHRGPDDEGILIDQSFGFGMRRLSIIDLEFGHQPVANEDGRLQVILNGEIYNYRELAEELRARGHSLKTTSDTEVIVHLYEDYGEDCVHRLRGMFAFAIWDSRDRTLMLARDRVGIKPLYYAPLASGLVFASELKAVLRCPDVSHDLDPKALVAYLQYGYVPDPLSIFQDVRKLPPGHTLVCHPNGTFEVRRYWDPAPSFEGSTTSCSKEALVDELRWRLTESVRAHLVSDVPVGAFLSGGLDSSTVVALMATALGHPVKTFSIGFAERSFNELPYARIVAERFGTDHREVVVEPTSLGLLETIAAQFDEPFADASAIPTYFLSRLASDHVKVALSGDGGDELFAGYDRYLVDYQRRRYDALAASGAARGVRWLSDVMPEGTPGKNFLFNVSLARTERYLDSVSHFAPRRLVQLLSEDFLAQVSVGSPVFAEHLDRGGSLPFPARLQYLDLKTYLPGDILTKVDRMSMAHSLEARVPFLDHLLIEFVATIPSRYHLEGGETKHLFKRAIRDLLPDEIMSRPKQGFAVPLGYWFRKKGDEFIRERLLDVDALTHTLFRRAYVQGLYELYHTTRRPDALERLWLLLVVEIWYATITHGSGVRTADVR